MPTPESAAPYHAVRLSWEGGERQLAVSTRVVLGRDPDVDVVIDHHRLSRLHCRLEAVEGGVKVTDLGSSNGTTVDGQAISQRVLRPGQEALLGGAVRVQIEGAGSPALTEPAGIPGPGVMAAPTPVKVPRGGLPSEPPQPPQSAPLRVPARTPKKKIVGTPVAGASEAPRPGSGGPPDAAAPLRGASSAGTPVRRARSRTGPLPTVLLGGGVLLAVLAFVWMRSGAEEQEASRMLAAVRTLESEGRLRDAQSLAERLGTEFADTPSGRAGSSEAARLSARVEKRVRGQLELNRVSLDPDVADREEAIRRLGAVRQEFHPEIQPQEVEQALAAVDRRLEARAEIAVARVAAEADALVQAGAFGRALDRAAHVEGAAGLTPAAQNHLEALRERITAAAGRSFDSYSKSLGNLDSADLVARLRDGLVSFRGTTFEGEIRARLVLAENAPPPAAVPGRSSDPTPGVVAPPPTDLLAKATEAEDLARRRRYVEAVPAFRAAVDAARGRPEAAALLERAERVERMAEVVRQIGRAVKDRPAAFRGLKAGGTLEGNVTACDTNKITVSLAGGGRLVWDWSRLPAEQLYSLWVRSGLDGAPSVDAALIFLDLGDPDRALDVLAARFEAEAHLRSRVERYAADARQMEQVPPGGFVLFRGRLLTVMEHEEAVLEARLSDLHDAVVSAAEPSGWAAAAAELRGHGQRGLDRLGSALQRRLEALRGKVLEHGALSKSNVAALRQRLVAELKTRREAALALIFDGNRYPYPYAENQHEIQAEVDGLVDQVRDVWSAPVKSLLAAEPVIAAWLDDARAAESMLTELGTASTEVPALLQKLNGVLDVSKMDAELAAHWTAVEAHNDNVLLAGEMSAPERECYRATNAYRVMLGRKAVMADSRLVQCARSHSEEMRTLGYFAHESPVAERKSPSQRAQLAGWGGSVSENIARGQADGADVVRQWCGSSGHHRNILGAKWTHLGAGRSAEGAFWTQNFGSGSTKPPR